MGMSGRERGRLGSIEQRSKLCMLNESFLSASKEKHTQMTHL